MCAIECSYVAFLSKSSTVSTASQFEISHVNLTIKCRLSGKSFVIEFRVSHRYSQNNMAMVAIKIVESVICAQPRQIDEHEISVTTRTLD